MSQYPYIENKDMYAAVMQACKDMSAGIQFNRSVRNAARRYKVNETECAEHVLLRNPGAARFYLSREVMYVEDNPVRKYGSIEIICCQNDITAAVYFIMDDAEKVIQLRHQYKNAKIYYAHDLVGDPEGYATKQEAEQARKEILSCANLQAADGNLTQNQAR